MPTTTRVHDAGPIRTRLGEIAEAGASMLGSLAGRDAHVEACEFLVRTGEELLARIAQPLLLIRQRIVGGSGEIGYLLGRREALTLACIARPNIPDQELLRRRLTAVLEPADLEALQDVAWLLAERGDRVLRRLTADRCGLAFEEIAALTPESCARLVPPSREHGVMHLRVLLEHVPPTDVVVIADPGACDVLDGGAHRPPVATPPPAEDGATDADAERLLEPRLRAHAFLIHDESWEAARRCCQKLGLALRRHPGHTAPNPAVIRDGLVLLDVPAGFEQRFDWGRRIKEARPEVAVAMLVHHPTRSRVLRAFEARADAVIGWPADPLELAIRLRKLTGRGPQGSR